MHECLLFDFDGVIVDSYDATYKIMRHEDPGLTGETYRQWFNGNVAQTVRKNLSPAAVKDFFARYLRQAKDLPLVPGIKELIQVQTKKRMLFIVSSTDARSIHAFLRDAGMENNFVEVFGYEAGANKTDKITNIIKTYKIDRAKSLFITDTSGDVIESVQAGVATVGVTWGYHDETTLTEAGPSYIVHSPAELRSCIEDYFNTSSSL